MPVCRYAMKPIGVGGSVALASVTTTITPWAAFGASAHAQVRLNGAERPKGLTEGLAV